MNYPSSGCDALPVSSLYETLDMVREEIRLLEILLSSDSEDEAVSCRPSTVPLEDAKLHYAALSYVWGDPTVTENIKVNGATLPVTVNLASALKRLRDSNALSAITPSLEHSLNRLDLIGHSLGSDTALNSNLLWADAVCIN